MQAGDDETIYLTRQASHPFVLHINAAAGAYWSVAEARLNSLLCSVHVGLYIYIVIHGRLTIFVTYCKSTTNQPCLPYIMYNIMCAEVFFLLSCHFRCHGLQPIALAPLVMTLKIKL